MTTIILVRHGESEANRLGFFAGQTDVLLMDKGMQQAQAAGGYIARQYKVDKVYASDLQRARKTGEIIAEIVGAELAVDRRLREINAGEWQGMQFDDLMTRYPDSYAVWRSDIGNCQCDGGESVRQLSERFMQALTDIAQAEAGKTIVIATHATPIRATQCILKGLPLDEMKNVPWVSNASVTELAYEQHVWRIVKEDESSFLSELKTSFPANV